MTASSCIMSQFHLQPWGMVVDYMARFSQGASVTDAFKVSLHGALMCGRLDEAKGYASCIKGLDDESILNACRLVWFDQVCRGKQGFGVPHDAVPNHETCENVHTMVKRVDSFLKQFGPIVVQCPLFGRCTDAVGGDGDFVTRDTIWDLKVSKNKPSSKHTLQLAMYYLLACRSTVPEYKNLTKIGIFNPRLNVAYVLDMRTVSQSVIKKIETDVIRYRD